MCFYMPVNILNLHKEGNFRLSIVKWDGCLNCMKVCCFVGSWFQIKHGESIVLPTCNRKSNSQAFHLFTAIIARLCHNLGNPVIRFSLSWNANKKSTTVSITPVKFIKVNSEKLCSTPLKKKMLYNSCIKLCVFGFGN